MVKAAISGLAMAALQVFAAEPAPTIGQHCTDMRIVSSEANARQVKLGYKKAVVIDLPVDIKEVLVADPATVTVLVRTMRRVYITGVALGKTNSAGMMSGRLSPLRLHFSGRIVEACPSTCRAPRDDWHGVRPSRYGSD